MADGKLTKWIHDLRDNNTPTALVVLFYYTATAGAFGAYSYRAARVVTVRDEEAVPTFSTGDVSLSVEVSIALGCLEKSSRVDTERSGILPLYDTSIPAMRGIRLVGAPVASLEFSTGEGMRTVGWYDGELIAKQSSRVHGKKHMAAIYAMRIVFRPTTTQLTKFTVNRQLNTGLLDTVEAHSWRLALATAGLCAGMAIADAAKTQNADDADNGIAAEFDFSEIPFDRAIVCFVDAAAYVTVSVLLAQTYSYLKAQNMYTHARLPLYKDCV
jgi:hypothetical protein